MNTRVIALLAPLKTAGNWRDRFSLTWIERRKAARHERLVGSAVIDAAQPHTAVKFEARWTGCAQVCQFTLGNSFIYAASMPGLFSLASFESAM
jgi:hypothetical protein